MDHLTRFAAVIVTPFEVSKVRLVLQRVEHPAHFGPFLLLVLQPLEHQEHHHSPGGGLPEREGRGIGGGARGHPWPREREGPAPSGVGGMERSGRLPAVIPLPPDGAGMRERIFFVFLCTI